MAQHRTKGGGLGAIAGFLAGIGVGLLFAPRSGSETREQLADYFRKGREKGEELLEEGKERVEGAPQTMTEGKEPFYESGKYT